MESGAVSDAMAMIFLLGAVQGVFLAAVLASRHRDALPNRLLAGLMLVFSADLAMAVVHSTGASSRLPFLIGLDLPIAFLYGPLLFLYVRTLAQRTATLHRRDGLHFIPFVALTLYLIPFFLQGGTEKLEMMNQPGASAQMRALVFVTPLKLVHGFVYLSLSVHSLRQLRASEDGLDSEAQRLTHRWLRLLTLGVLLLLSIAAILYALGSGMVPVLGMDPTGMYDDLTLLSVTVFVYALGYFGLRHPSLFAARGAEEAHAAEGSAPYARSGMSSDDAALQRERLTALMDGEHLYRRGDLTLQDLAGALGISTHNLTEVLSTQFNQSFYELVNSYRVREVQERLADPSLAHLTVLALAMDAGFNAKSSFNAAFKRHTGVTPSEYRRGVREVV